jgi:hypothetical protein
MTVTDTPSAVIASAEEDYRRLGIDRGAVRTWEDGARTDNRRGTYEWWYSTRTSRTARRSWCS